MKDAHQSLNLLVVEDNPGDYALRDAYLKLGEINTGKTVLATSMTEAERQAVNITPGLIRISVGLEHPDDVLNDILQALEKS